MTDPEALIEAHRQVDDIAFQHSGTVYVEFQSRSAVILVEKPYKLKLKDGEYEAVITLMRRTKGDTP